MKKIISTLAIAFCLVNSSNAQVMDSSLTTKPGHRPETPSDTTHSTKMNRKTNPGKNHTMGADSTMQGVKPTDRKTNPGKPSTNKPM